MSLQLVDAVCRPPRDDRYTEAELTGGQRASFKFGETWELIRKYYRQDVILVSLHLSVQYRGAALAGCVCPALLSPA